MVTERTNQFTILDIKRYAGALLDVLEQERIASITDLGARIPFQCRAPSTFPDFVVLDMGNSARGTSAYLIDYICPGRGGIPLEGRINISIEYAEVILKADKIIAGYERWGMDSFGNIRQDKKMLDGGFDDVLREFRRLRDLPD